MKTIHCIVCMYIVYIVRLIFSGIAVKCYAEGELARDCPNPEDICYTKRELNNICNTKCELKYLLHKTGAQYLLNIFAQYLRHKT